MCTSNITSKTEHYLQPIVHASLLSVSKKTLDLGFFFFWTNEDVGIFNSSILYALDYYMKKFHEKPQDSSKRF